MNTLADEVRRAIRTCDKSLNALGTEAGIDKGILSRFLRGERSIQVDTVDKLLGPLGIADVRLVRRRQKKGTVSDEKA